MGKIRFVIAGSGWRSLYYVRIAKALPEVFELCAMYCRTQEKADKMAAEHKIHTTISIEECLQYKPDFVVVVVTKADIAKVSMEWMDRGCAVLCETPAAMNLPELNELWKRHLAGQKLVVAEQYTHYPIYQAMRKVLDKELLGSRDVLNLSLANDHHGASLMREFLKVTSGTGFKVSGKKYDFPTTQTLTRYDKFMDGSIAMKKRVVATFEFEDGKVALYDFDSEQYRSPIRKNLFKLQGVRGEFYNNQLYFLDEHNEGKKEELIVKTRSVHTEYDNPNLSDIEEVTEILFGDEVVYTPEFGLCGLAQDETAIATLMRQAAEYVRGENEPPYKLSDALTDAYMALLLEEACMTEQKICSQPQSWN